MQKVLISFYSPFYNGDFKNLKSPKAKSPTSFEEKGAGGICSGHLLTRPRSWQIFIQPLMMCYAWLLSEHLTQNHRPVQMSNRSGD